MSVFNPDQFLNTSTKNKMDDKYVPVPEGVFLAQVKSVTPRQTNPSDGSAPKTMLEVRWIILDEEAKKATGMDEPAAKQTVWLDLTPEGGLDFSKGKNVQLGKLREALGQNKEGKAWSPSHIVGGTAQVVVGHRPDRDDPETVYAEVKKVARSS